jgi:hypothetical protein
MSKTKIILGASLTGFASLTGVSAKADSEVIRTTEKGASGEVIKEGKTLQEDINSINKLISNISKNYDNVEIGKSTITLTDENRNEVKSKLVELQKVLNKLESQNVKFKSLSTNAIKFGLTIDESTIEKIDLSNLDNVTNKLNSIVAERDRLIYENKETIERAAVSSSSATYNKAFNESVETANKRISELTALDDHYTDGILGNVKELNEKADAVTRDSGLKVDTTKTKANNVITKTSEFVRNDNAIVELSDVEKATNDVISKINNVRKSNEAEVVKSKTYTTNAVKNMELINNWLKGASNQTNKVKEDVEKNSKASTLIKEYKETQKAELLKLKDKVSKSDKPEKVKTKMLEDIDKAIATIEASGVTVNVVGKIDAIGNLDFGDIGRDSSEIQKLMDNASNQINASVGSSLDNLKTKNAASLAKVEPVIQNNIERIKKYIEGIDKGGTSTQIDEAWLNTRPIYSGDTSGKYKKYVEDALKQTAESTEGVFTGSQELGPNMTLKYAKEGKTIANIAAAQWMDDSKKGLKGAFGSVMVPSKNINDFVTVRGTKAANSQKFKGGAQGILDHIASKAWVSGTQRHNIYKEAVFADIKNQHIDYVGNENVFLVASYQDHITFDFKDSYVTYDENGKPKTYPLSLTMHAMPFSGSKFPNDLPGNSRLMFLYYLSVDPKTGKVLTGVGYYRHIQSATGHNGGGGSSGELRLGVNEGNAGDYNDSITLKAQRLLSPIAYASQASNPFTKVGLWTTFDVRVDEAAGEGAKRSPLYIGDIDDNQTLYVHKDTHGTNTDIILSGNDAPKIRDGGDYGYYALDTNVPKSNGLAAGANLDKNSVMITGQSTVGIGHGGWYQSIDVSLFNPWGIIGGSPSLSLEKVNANVDTIQVNTPNVTAHTEGNYTLKDVKAELNSKPDAAAGTLYKVDYKILLPNIANEKEDIKRVASNTSFVVKKLEDIAKHSASGNTLVVRGVDSLKSSSGNTLIVRQLDGLRSSSGNSIIVKTITTDTKSSSGNTLVVKTTKPIETISASNNSIVTKVVNNELKIKNKEVNVKVYTDESLKPEVEKALSDWKDAFSKHNINFNYKFTSVNEGVDIAFLDSDNETTRVDRGWLSVDTDDDYAFEMTELAGLMTKTSTVDLVDADSNDKYSRNGIRSKDILKKAKYIVQLNTDAIKSSISKEKVLKHEIGHVFGLEHDNNDSLMTTFYNDPIFNGDISIKDASLAVEHINKGKFCTCESCMKLRK